MASTFIRATVHDIAPSIANISSSACPLGTISELEQGHKLRNRVPQLAEAEHFYEDENFDACAQKCYEVLQAEPTEAIRARCHMYLATAAVGPELASGRARHAEMAMGSWRVVVERKGASRFPVERARAELERAESLLEEAEDEAAEQVGEVTASGVFEGVEPEEGLLGITEA